MKKQNIAMNLILLIGYFICLVATSVAADEKFQGVSKEDMLYVEGLISKVYPESMQISVTPPKSKRVIITINSDTILEGVLQIKEFKKEQRVKVWFSTDEDSNQAIKIYKMLELGC